MIVFFCKNNHSILKLTWSPFWFNVNKNIITDWNMIVVPIIGFLVIGATNYIGSRMGFSNFQTGDRDILFPFSATIFLFFSLLIYLPEVSFFRFRYMEELRVYNHNHPASRDNYRRKMMKRRSHWPFCSRSWQSAWLSSWIGFV